MTALLGKVMPIITNTTERPLFVAGRMLQPGQSCECDAHDIPACLIPITPADVSAEDAATADTVAVDSVVTADTVAVDSVVTAEDQLVAAVKSKK